jgi:hypothetical protein
MRASASRPFALLADQLADFAWSMNDAIVSSTFTRPSGAP